MARSHEDNFTLVAILAGGGYIAYRMFSDKAHGSSLPITSASPPLGVSISTVPEPVAKKPAGPSGGGIVLPTTAQLNNTNLPRGIRNNNPGNIKASANAWKGKIGKDAGGFEVFDTAQNGLRAMGILLRTYFTNYGLNTITKISNRWTATNPTSWAAAVAKYSVLGKDVSILDMNQTMLMALMQGITAAENGAKYVDYYSPATRALAAQAALGG